jgi:hypothetical protein
MHFPISVTITGADDATSPYALVALARAYPSLEWGILYSDKRAGTPRYPSAAWRAALPDLPDVRYALHLCGSAAREVVVAGVPRRAVDRRYARVQINGYEPGSPGSLATGDVRWILQCREEAALPIVTEDARAIGGEVLYDPSGGRGHRLTLPRWLTPIADVRIGYAGGIGPDHVTEVLDAIAAATGRRHGFWIDMESGVRDAHDRLDLDRAQEVLVRVRDWTKKHSVAPADEMEAHDG